MTPMGSRTLSMSAWDITDARGWRHDCAGGEEFAVLIATWPIGLAETVLERLRDATPEGLTCSAGLAAFDGSETAEALVARADQALYEAKARGRDRTAIATAEQDRHTD